ncbi:hypothetical protein HHK36_018684 [Tetracentron sinense]|uniref:Ubiquitin-like protease family profile domain-containing protein n=1 Tax=Tetracentron sinense TaxID=13715 RepID=A0A834Z1W8_TETSI|nr:hypothetical protein HHK36_018684 [Tetracentron sinense]
MVTKEKNERDRIKNGITSSLKFAVKPKDGLPPTWSCERVYIPFHHQNHWILAVLEPPKRHNILLDSLFSDTLTRKKECDILEPDIILRYCIHILVQDFTSETTLLLPDRETENPFRFTWTKKRVLGGRTLERQERYITIEEKGWG